MQKKLTQYRSVLMGLLVIGLVKGLTACGAGDGSGLDANGLPVDSQVDSQVDNEPVNIVVEPTLDSIQKNVFGGVCSECHSGVTPAAGLGLDSKERSFELLVSFTSGQDEDFSRVEPGDSDNSYLIQKLEGTALVPTRMPLGQPALSNETIQAIRTWINNGALFDE